MDMTEHVRKKQQAQRGQQTEDPVDWIDSKKTVDEETDYPINPSIGFDSYLRNQKAADNIEGHNCVCANNVGDWPPKMIGDHYNGQDETKSA